MLHLNSIDLKCIKGGSNVTIAPIAALGTAWIVTLVILAILIIAPVSYTHLRTIARIAAFIPGASPPLVKTPIVLISPI